MVCAVSRTHALGSGTLVCAKLIEPTCLSLNVWDVFRSPVSSLVANTSQCYPSKVNKGNRWAEGLEAVKNECGSSNPLTRQS